MFEAPCRDVYVGGANRPAAIHNHAEVLLPYVHAVVTLAHPAAYVEDWQLQLEVSKVPRAICQALSTCLADARLVADALQQHT
jgi:hypothetical protein